MRIHTSKLIACILPLIGGLLPSVAIAQSKVGYVDIDRVTAKSVAVNSAMGSVQDKVKKFQEDLETKKKKLRDLEADIKRTEGVVSSDEQNRKKKEAITVRNEMDDLELQAKREMQKLDDTFFAPTLKRIVYAIQDVAKEKELELVVRGEAVLYGSDSADITEDVIRKLNAEEGKPAGKTSSDAPAAKSTPAADPKAAATATPAATSSPAAATPRGTTRPAGSRPVDRQPD